MRADGTDQGNRAREAGGQLLARLVAFGDKARNMGPQIYFKSRIKIYDRRRTRNCEAMAPRFLYGAAMPKRVPARTAAT